MVTVLVAALALAVRPAAAQVYRWTDEEGVIHLATDPSRIPDRYRGAVEILESSPREPVESPTGHVVPAEPGTPLLAEAHLNGVRLALLVDTGADRTIIAPGALARAGLDVAGGRPVALVGVGGAVRATEIVVPRLDLAGAQIGPIAVIAFDLPGLGADGLLGRDVLEHFVLTIDQGRGRAILTR